MGRPLVRGMSALPARQRGQALVFIAITAVLVLLATLILYSSGQLATQRIKLQNTADAAAYSAAIVEARDYNFSAYANRAMVANQVAVAQFVGLTSWARNMQNTYKGELSSVPDIFASFSSFKSMWDVPWNIAENLADSIKNVVENAAKIMVPVLNGLLEALSIGSIAYHVAMIEAVPTTVNEVIEKNDPDAKLTTAGIGFFVKHFAMDWREFTSFSGYNPTESGSDSQGSYENRFANVTLDSTDLFHKGRNYGLPALTPSLVDPTKF
ncbi:MAG: hypothetical protein KIT18_03190, partial [Burkholderiales bacterium]|nr:hypothetical protein [Burkholderiales bacterium]